MKLLICGSFFLRTCKFKKMSGLLSGGLPFCMLFTNFGDVIMFSICMPLLMLKRREFEKDHNNNTKKILRTLGSFGISFPTLRDLLAEG